MSCNYKPTERPGLYIMLWLIWASGPSDVASRHEQKQMQEAIQRIESRLTNSVVVMHQGFDGISHGAEWIQGGRIPEDGGAQ